MFGSNEDKTDNSPAVTESSTNSVNEQPDFNKEKLQQAFQQQAQQKELLKGGTGSCEDLVELAEELNEINQHPTTKTSQDFMTVTEQTVGVKENPPQKPPVKTGQKSGRLLTLEEGKAKGRCPMCRKKLKIIGTELGSVSMWWGFLSKTSIREITLV